MRDPLDALENFDPGAPMDPLPPAEVCRLGDRHRRRRTTALSLATAAAVAVVATGGAVLAGGAGDRDAAPDPADRPPARGTTWLTQPPDGFDVGTGMLRGDDGSAGTVVSGGPSVVTAELCGVDALASGDVGNELTAEVTGPEYADRRELRLYPDDEAAAAAVQEVRLAAADCPSEDYGTTTWRHEASPAALGEEAVLLLRTYEDSGLVVPGAEIWHVVRVGNAVLATATGGEFFPGQTLEPGIVEQERRLTQVVDDMCVFSADPCDSEPVEQVPLPTPDQLPARDRLTAWESLGTYEGPALACQSAPLESLSPTAIAATSFGGRIAAADGLPAGEDVSSQVNVAVLDLADAAALEAARETALGWIRDCTDPVELDVEAQQQETVVELPGGEYRTWTYAAPDVCTDCDAVRFDRMAVFVVGQRLVLVSLAEVGGPLEPEGLDATMSGLVDLMISLTTPVGS